jgi:hypothetical protein
MQLFKQPTASHLGLLGVMALLGLGLVWPLLGTAREKPVAHSKHKHTAKPADHAKDLAAQLRELQTKVAKIEAALKQNHDGDSSDTETAGDMHQVMGGKKKMGMGMMGGGRGGMGMGMMDRDMDRDMDMMGMMGMGRMKGMKGMAKMQKTASLPGFPGGSHIYHIGATGFFLDHPKHIRLTRKQKIELNRIKEKALLNKATTQRKVDEAEQELWALTGSDRPAATKIEAKVREIERLRGDQRLAFIRAVGEAGKVLTDQQRKALLGIATGKGTGTDAHSGH